MLLIAPVTILLCQRLGLPVVPFLMAEVFASNIGGTATLVGDPPNIIIASRGGLSFNDFLVHLAPVVVVLVAVLIGLCRWLFADAFRLDEERVAEILALNEREAIQDHRLLWQSLTVLGVVLVAFVLSPVLGYEPVGGGAARRRAARSPSPGSAPRPRCRTSSGPPWRSSWGCSSWSAAWSRPASWRRSPGSVADFAGEDLLALHRCTAVGVRACCPASSTTSPTSPA